MIQEALMPGNSLWESLNMDIHNMEILFIKNLNMVIHNILPLNMQRLNEDL